MTTIASLSANPDVAFAEPDYITVLEPSHTTNIAPSAIARAALTPNDPLFASQWGLTKIGADTAWNTVRGTPSVVIAIIDSGIDMSHPDLVAQRWTNPGEIPNNGFDDDNNGYVDDVYGWNFVGGNNNISDDNGHGTLVAGVAGAATNNGMGIAGMCWYCRLMIVKVMNSGGTANYSDIAAGVAYASAKGAHVINLSLGGYANSATLQAAIDAATNAVIVGGAGNDNVTTPFYPAAYANVIGVAATHITDTKATFSDYGAWVKLAAPGVGITTTLSGGGYGASSGTSLSAPFVSGLAGLLRTLNPAWSPTLVRAHILHTAISLTTSDPTYGSQLGAGLVNAANAMQAARPSFTFSSYTLNGALNGRPNPGSSNILNIALYNDWLDATNVFGILSTTDPFAAVMVNTAPFGNIPSGATGNNSAPFVFNVSPGAGYNHAIPFMLQLVANGGAYVTTVPLTVTTQSDVVIVSGFITSDTVWTRDRIYEIASNVQVNSGVTLTIQSGTQVRFRAGRILQIAGTLIASGQPNAPILFTSAVSKTYGVWGPINFVSSAISATMDTNGNYPAGSIIRHARIEYGSGVVIVQSPPYLSHNTFFSNSGSQFDCCSSAVISYYDPSQSISTTFAVRNSTVRDNGAYGIALTGLVGRFEVTDNHITDQSGAGIIQSNVGGYTALIARNTLLRTHGIVILSDSHGTVIEDNYVAESTGAGYIGGGSF
jgi:subtilisin family serine protease